MNCPRTMVPARIRLDAKCGVEGNGLFSVLKAKVFCRKLDRIVWLIGFHININQIYTVFNTYLQDMVIEHFHTHGSLPSRISAIRSQARPSPYGLAACAIFVYSA